MKVRTIVPHEASDGREHAMGDVYELEGIELTLRLKDFIVCDASNPDPAVPTGEKSKLAPAPAVTSDVAARTAPPSNPTE